MSNKTHSAKKRVRPPRSVDRLAQDDRGVTETSIVVNESTSNQALPDQCAPYFAALVRYIDGFYAVAMEYGIPAAKVLHHVQHAHSAVVGLQKLVAADEPKAYPHLPFDCPHADHRCSGCGLPLAEVRGAQPPPGAMTEQRSEDPMTLVEKLKAIGGRCDSAVAAEAFEAILRRYSWLPITTAPEKTEVLVRFPPIVKGGRDFFGVAEKTFGVWHKPGRPLDELRFPTHWMHIPRFPHE